jgi:antitoxin HicB
MEKNLNYYLALPYTIELQNDLEEGWFVRVKELPGCMSQGQTAEEALEMIRDAMQIWLEVSLEKGIPIPEPKSEEEFSGKFVVRVPRSLHRRLVEEAEREGVSLNQYINVSLSSAVSAQPLSGQILEKSISNKEKYTFENVDSLESRHEQMVNQLTFSLFSQVGQVSMWHEELTTSETLQGLIKQLS